MLQDLEDEDWPKEWTQSLVIPLPKEGNLKSCQNYCTVSLISHPSWITLRVTLHRLNNKVEELPTEEQAIFRPGRSKMYHIFTSRGINEKHPLHQRDLFHNFVDFKMFYRVWHARLWQVLRSFNMEEGLVQATQALYKNSSRAVLLNSQQGEFFKTTVDARKECLLSPILFNLFLEKIVQ